MNIARMICAAGCALSSLATLAQGTVSYSGPAGPCKDVVAAIGTALDAEWTVRPELARSPLFVSVTDVDPAALRERIAQVVGGEWRETKTGWELTETAASRTAFRAAAQATRLSAARASLAKRLATPGTQAWDAESIRKAIAAERERRKKLLDQIGEDAASANSMVMSVSNGEGASTPAQLALAAALRGLSAETLAGMAPGQRTVYSSRPTAMQKPLPFDGPATLARTVEAYNLVCEESKGFAEEFANVRHMGGLPLGGERLTLLNARLLVTVACPSSGDGVRVEALLVDSEAKVVAQDSAWLSLRAQPTPGEPPAEVAELEAPVSEVARQLASAIKAPGEDSGQSRRFSFNSGSGMVFVSDGSHAPPAPLSAEAEAALADPVRHDPVEAMIGEPLRTAASQMDVVASVPDMALVTASRALDKPTTTVGAVLKALASRGAVDLQGAGGWLTIRPSDPDASARRQMPREATRDLVQAIRAKGYARLGETASFAQALGVEPLLDGLGCRYVRGYSPATYALIEQAAPHDLKALQLYGLLEKGTTGQVEVDKREFKIGALDQKQRSVLNRIVFGAGGQGVGAGEGPGNTTALAIRTGPGEGMPSLDRTLANEPTEAYALGLPNDGMVRLTYESSQAAFGTVPKVRGGRFYTGQALGTERALREKGQMEGASALPTLFVEASLRAVTIETVLDKKTRHLAQLADAWTLDGRLPVAFDQLPDGFRALVATVQEQMSNLSVPMFRNRPDPPSQT